MAQLKLNNFFENDLKPYSIYDSQRSIASAIDGLKITSRKVLYTCLQGNITSDIKVAQLQSRVAFETHFHHGEGSIGGVICNMAQSFAGTNNINLLEPVGQFGSRLCATPAATRYIFTKLSKETRELFKKTDDAILEYLSDDDEQIEPNYYLPILPLILINGSEGIGTGFASKVLSYNPDDIKQDMLNVINKKSRKPLVPWFKGFAGSIKSGENPNQWIIQGKLEITGSTTLKITELPIGMYSDQINKILNTLKEKEIIKDYENNSTEDGFDIDVSCPRSTIALGEEKLIELFKLTSKESENLTLWNHNEKLQVFTSASEIVEYFVNFRTTKFEKRRQHQIIEVEENILMLDERIRFINYYLENTQLFKGTGKKELLELLKTNDFNEPEKLLSMTIWTLTKDKIEELNKELEKRILLLEELNNDNATNMFSKELKELKF